MPSPVSPRKTNCFSACLRALCCCAVIVFSVSVFGQAELEKVIPLSPNAASIAKYGEIPVSQFTGIPSVSVPVYEVKSKRLSLPLTLSYHAGGNKVEEVASWVGLGWSLSGAPMISRSVRGIPDEAIDGYFSKLTTLLERGSGGAMTPIQYNPPLTIKTLQDSGYNYLNNGDWWVNYMIAIYRNQTDPEADIFFYTLPGKSGKFFWDQVNNTFHTYPWSNLKITYSGNAFEIIDDDGTIYKFPASLRETATVAGSSLGEQVVNSWWASKMYDANMTDSISFSYGLENQTNYTLDPSMKTLFGTCDNSFSGSIATTAAYTLSGITFSNGSVVFTKDTAARQDLSGGYALKSIAVYNDASLLVKKIELSHFYKVATTPSNYSATVGKRLFLKEITQSGSGNIYGGKHSFEYDTTLAFPHRLSMAQDYWGYYNGATTNTELTPTGFFISPASGVIQVAGANREVDANFSQFGILKKVVYPTGGYSDFTYENNLAYNDDLPPATVLNMAALEFGEAPPETTTFIDTFTISVPPHFYLNAFLGGANVDAEIGSLGCELNGQANTCAMLTVRGLDSANSNIFYYVTSNIDFHLPNGNYEIKAVFDQDPPAYQNFFFVLTWNIIDTTKLNTLVGGLRVKTISSYDGTGKQLFKEYKYTTRMDGDTSSGDIFGTPYFVGYDNFYPQSNSQCYRMFAQNNQVFVSHSGSFIGYKSVYETTDSLAQQGLTEYQFTSEKDLADNQSPFPPPYTMEAFRGQPRQTTYFKYQGGGYIPVSRISYTYANKIFDSLSTYCVKAKLVAPAVMDGMNVTTPPSYNWTFYDFAPAWSAVSTQTEQLYDPADTTRFIETITEYEYSPTHYQLVKTSTTNSQNQVVETRLHYPPDITLSGTAEDARQAMVQRNVLTPTLKQEKKVAGNSIEILETRYKKFHSTNIVRPEQIKLQRGNFIAETRIEFTGYDLSGNLLSQKKSNNISQAYVWDYQSTYPIAEVLNATEQHVAYTSFESDGKGSWTFSGTPAVDTNAPTGTKVYLLSNGNISRSIDASKIYIISLWATSAPTVFNASLQHTGITVSGYTYYEYETSAAATSVQVSGSATIDELRLYPKGAQMNSYTYMPLLGITTQCDLNNRISRYEYDALGRLLFIRDTERNILKQYLYKYHDQQ